MKTLYLCMLVPCLWLAAPPPLAAQALQAPAEKAVKKPAAARTIPFNGTVSAVDLEASTIKVGKRVFHVVKATRILKDDKPVTLSEALVGQRIGGSYVATEEGMLEARTIRVSPPKNSDETPKEP